VKTAWPAIIAFLALVKPVQAAETLPPTIAAYVDAIKGCSGYSDPMVTIRERLTKIGWAEAPSGFADGDGDSATFLKDGSKLLFVQSDDGKETIWTCTVTAKLGIASTVDDLNAALAREFQGFSTAVGPEAEYMIFPKGARPFQVKFASAKAGLDVTTIFVDSRKRQKQ
jgi:hypothetical protein